MNLGIIVHITKTLQSVAKENHLNEIGSVTLEVGEVSSIVPDYLTDCWRITGRSSRSSRRRR